MSRIFEDYTVKALDDMFKEANNFFNTENFQAAYAKCDDIKRVVKNLQGQAINGIATIGTGIGVVGGLVFPGVGNIVGGVVGGVVGRWVGKYLAKQVFSSNGSMEDIIELACAGKLEAMEAQKRKHTKSVLPNGTYSTQTAPIYSRWCAIKSEVI